MELTSHIHAHTGLLGVVRKIAPAPGEGRDTRTRRLLPLAWLAAAALMVLLLARNGGQFVHALQRALHGGWQLVALGAVLEAASIAGYVILQHRMIGAGDRRIRPKDSYDIALAGTAATRLLPTAGLGGAALTAWALKARGVRGAEIAERLLAFLLLIYAVYMAALLVFGAAVGFGLVHVASGRALGVLAAVLALISTAAVTLLAAPHRIAGLLRGAAGNGRFADRAERAAQELPALRGALRRTVAEIRRPRLAHLGAVAWWAFDIGVLVAMLHAFGAALPIPVVVLAYFLGTMFDVLLLPGQPRPPAACRGSASPPASRRRAGLPHDRGLAARRFGRGLAVLTAHHRRALERGAGDGGLLSGGRYRVAFFAALRAFPAAFLALPAAFSAAPRASLPGLPPAAPAFCFARPFASFAFPARVECGHPCQFLSSTCSRDVPAHGAARRLRGPSGMGGYPHPGPPARRIGPSAPGGEALRRVQRDPKGAPMPPTSRPRRGP